MFNSGLIIPALIGFGLYSQGNELCLSNNTTILLMLVMLMQDHKEIEELKCRDKDHRDLCDFRHGCGDHCYTEPGGGIGIRRELGYYDGYGYGHGHGHGGCRTCCGGGGRRRGGCHNIHPHKQPHCGCDGNENGISFL